MKTERVFVCLFVIAFLSKMLHVPVGGFMLELTAVAMGISYLFLGFYLFSDESIKTQNLVFSIVAGIFLSICPYAIMSRLMFWPESGTDLLYSLIFSFSILCIAWFLRKKTAGNLQQYYRNMFSRSLTLLSFSAILLITPVSFLARIEYSDNPELAEMTSRLASDPDNAALRKQYETYLKTHTRSGKPIKALMPKNPADTSHATAPQK